MLIQSYMFILLLIPPKSQFQQEQMHEFCAEAVDHIDPELPSSPDELNTLFQHLLYDDSHRMVFCYVPKNGCSNMKRMMLVLNGILPPESSLERRPPEPVLKQVLHVNQGSSRIHSDTYAQGVYMARVNISGANAVGTGLNPIEEGAIKINFAHFY